LPRAWQVFISWTYYPVIVERIGCKEIHIHQHIIRVHERDSLTSARRCLTGTEDVPRRIRKELRIAAAVKLFELGKLSSGAAARLVGIPRTLFLALLANYGVDTFRLTEEDLKAEAVFA